VPRWNSSRSPALGAIIFTAIVGAIVGAIATAPASSPLSPVTASVPSCGADQGDSTYEYFPAQFGAPEGPVAEPIATY
jgi:hypothetical protein